MILQRTIVPGVLLVLAAGCAPREAFYRPAAAPALGRDGFVGAASRIPPGARDSEAQAVAALGPARRERAADGGEAWRVAALIELRNKREGAITFLPEAVRLVTADGAAHAPAALTRTGRNEPVAGPVEIPYWHQASFHAVWLLPAADGGKPPEPPLALAWEYRFAGQGCPQSVPFVGAGPELAARSLSGGADGLASGSSYSSSSGVPFLMDLPFAGALFRSGTEVRSTSRTEFGTAPSSGGTWWPLEPPVADDPTGRRTKP